MKIDISVNAKKITLRTMQCATFMTLAIAFMFSMPYIFNGFLLNKENKRLIELLGYMQDSPDKLQPWVWRLHIVLLASAIVLSEVFFDGTILPVAILIFTCTLLAVSGYLILEFKNNKH